MRWSLRMRDTEHGDNIELSMHKLMWNSVQETVLCVWCAVVLERWGAPSYKNLRWVCAMWAFALLVCSQTRLGTMHFVIYAHRVSRKHHCYPETEKRHPHSHSVKCNRLSNSRTNAPRHHDSISRCSLFFRAVDGRPSAPIIDQTTQLTTQSISITARHGHKTHEVLYVMWGVFVVIVVKWAFASFSA